MHYVQIAVHDHLVSTEINLFVFFIIKNGDKNTLDKLLTNLEYLSKDCPLPSAVYILYVHISIFQTHFQSAMISTNISLNRDSQPLEQEKA